MRRAVKGITPLGAASTGPTAAVSPITLTLLGFATSTQILPVMPLRVTDLSTVEQTLQHVSVLKDSTKGNR